MSWDENVMKVSIHDNIVLLQGQISVFVNESPPQMFLKILHHDGATSNVL